MKFTKHSRKLIIDAGKKLEWDQINPDILGSMIQAVASEDSRSHLGMHYTSVPNIMKVIKPLFLDELRQAFEDAKGSEKKLNQLYDRIGKIKFMDPACGSGNFLIITYKELRQLEIDILKELNRMGIATMYVPSVTLDQFYGIEIDDFACDVTRLSLWIAEHQMNKQLHKEIADAIRPTLPLQHAGAIVCGNALRIDWNEVLPHEKDDEVYLFGNPPYLGSAVQGREQKEDLQFLLRDEIPHYSRLDYISGWFYLAAKFSANSNSSFSFVSTNSICQGEQVAPLWTALLKYVHIQFAYQSFLWSNSAKNNAGVYVVIIGMIPSNKQSQNCIIWNQDGYKRIVQSINPYLIEGSNLIVKKSNRPLNNFPEMIKGSQPTDGGGLIFSKDEKNNAVSNYPGLAKYFKKFVGSKEFISSCPRYVLWFSDQSYKEVQNNPLVKKRIEIVKETRLNSKNKATRRAAKTPFLFQHIASPYMNANRFKQSIIVPSVSSRNRLYAPMGIVDENTVISNLALLIYDAPFWLLGLLESRMHMVWLKTVGGRLKTDYRYSAVLVYNTFPVPELSTRRKNEIEDLVWKILDIRDEEGGTLAELYGSPLATKNPKPMNPRLKAAHEELDQVVDRAYRDDHSKMIMNV